MTVLGAVTGLPSNVLGSMIGRQLPFFALLLPFYVMALYGGARVVAGAVARIAGRGRLLRLLPVHLVELHQLRVDGRSGFAWVPHRDAWVPASLETRARRRIRSARPSRFGSHRFRRWTVARLASVAHRDGRRHPLDDVQHSGDRTAGDPLAGPRQGDLDHAVQRQALRRGMGVPAARHRHRDFSVRHHHRRGRRNRRCGFLPSACERRSPRPGSRF